LLSKTGKLGRALNQTLKVFLPVDEEGAGPVKAKVGKSKRKRG
jgi:hypothetical protein